MSTASVDVVIIGSGVIGRSCAWQLARAGSSVVLLDPYPGSGASYVAAGMLAPVTEAAYGEEAAIALALRSAEAWPRFAAEVEEDSGLDPSYRRTGTLLVGANASDRTYLDELYRFHVQLGLPSHLVGPSQAREIEPLLAPSTRGGIFAAGDAQVDNRRLLGALSIASQRRGVLEQRTRVLEVVSRAGRVVGVRTEAGLINAEAVLLAAGFGSIDLPGLPEGYAPPTRPVKGQILRLRAGGHAPLLAATVRAIVSGFSVYVVPRTDGRVVVGATQEDVGADETITAGGVYTLLRDALQVLPALAEYELIEASAGLRPGSPDNVAMVGESGVPGLLLATGHHRNGFLFAPLTAETIVSIVSSGSVPSYAAPFAPERFASVTSRTSGTRSR